MKRSLPFVTLLAALAIVCGWLLSSITFIGRVGLNVFYKQYRFLKVWWQGAALVFVVWMLLFWLHSLAQRKTSPGAAKLMHIAGLIVSATGLYLTYRSFRTDISYRLMGERFHLGAYLFWVGWMAISVFFLSARRNLSTSQVQVERP